MLVIVFLEDAKKHTVVPESFIYDLNEKNLKNLGVNRNQRRLVYFSKQWFENMERKVNLGDEFVPNFHHPITKDYPLPEGLAETCFIGRLIHFEGNKCSVEMMQSI